MREEYLRAVADAMGSDDTQRQVGFDALLPHVRHAFHTDGTLPDQCVLFAAIKHVDEPAAFALLHAMLKMNDRLDDTQAAGLRARGTELLAYALCTERRLQTYFWSICGVLWKHAIAPLHPATACHLWRRYLADIAPVTVSAEAVKEPLMTVLHLSQLLPLDDQDVHQFVFDVCVSYRSAVATSSKLQACVIATLHRLFVTPAFVSLPAAWAKWLSTQLETEHAELAAVLLDELTRGGSNVVAPLVDAGICGQLLRMLHTQSGAKRVTCGVRAMLNMAKRSFVAWNVLVQPDAMTTYALVLQRDAAECVKACVRQLVTALCVFPDCLREYMRQSGLEAVLQQDAAAGRFRGSAAADLFIDVLAVSSAADA